MVSSRTEQAEFEVADAIGQLLEFWGFKRPMGRMWALLYLSPDPLTASTLGKRLRMSAGAVCMTLAELVKWGAARKTWRPGERADFYQAETSVWKLVTRVVRERELRLAREVGETLRGAVRALPRSAKSKHDREALEFKRVRIETLQRLVEVGERLLGAVDTGGPVDPSPLRRLGEGPIGP
jgi:HTH-type transcriptional regulator, glycine betaine synthesis regulator